jgi:predicted ATPase
VLVGPNMSGKSNLIECLKFIQDAVALRSQPNTSALQGAFSKRGGFSEVVWKGQPQGPITLGFSAELPGATGERLRCYKYEFSIRRSAYGSQEVDSEKLTVESGGTSETLIDNANGKLTVLREGKLKEFPQNRIDLALELHGRDPDTESSNFWNSVSNWRFYHLVPTLMRQSNPPSWERHLLEHGENLSTWLLTLQNQAREFNSIKQVFRDVLPGVSEILFQPVEPPKTPISSEPGGSSMTYSFESSKISVGVGETHFRKAIGIDRMSDGELAFLALISLILAPQDLTPPLLCIEEPESHLHPKLLETLVELLNQRQLGTLAPQIIATTHSPLLVDKLDIDDLVITQRSEGSTRFARASSKRKLKELLASKELGLGDLWYSGALDAS